MGPWKRKLTSVLITGRMLGHRIAQPPVAVITSATCRLGNDNVFGADAAYQFLLFLRSRRISSRCLLKSRPFRSEGYGCDSPFSPFQSTMLKLSESSLSSAVKSKSFVLPAQ